MKYLLLILSFLILSCGTTTPLPSTEESKYLRISEVNPNKLTALTRQNLEHLLGVYKLSDVIYTSDVVIQSGVVPRSHPTLTINTRYAENPHKLLAVFIHEQLHWWARNNKQNSQTAREQLRLIYPGQKDSYYEHLQICFLEYETLTHLLSKREAESILRDFILENIHASVYAEVMSNYTEINKVILNNQLKPKFLRKGPQKPTKKPPL